MINNVFELTDVTLRKIRLTNERWKHLAKHPEVVDKQEDIQETLRSPHTITNYSLDHSIKYYYTYYKQRRNAKYLRVIVKYLNGHGFVVTAYFVGKLQ